MLQIFFAFALCFCSVSALAQFNTLKITKQLPQTTGHEFSDSLIERLTYENSAKSRPLTEISKKKRDSISANIINVNRNNASKPHLNEPSLNATTIAKVQSIQELAYSEVVDSLMLQLFQENMIRDFAKRKRLVGNSNLQESDLVDTNVYGKYYTDRTLTPSSLMAEILRNGIKHPRIVFAQAVLETGWFTSRVCRSYNNLFGLRQPWDGEYFRFNTWQESVTAYKTKVQYKYKGGNYLRWLRTLGYAEDPTYTDKLKLLLPRLF